MPRDLIRGGSAVLPPDQSHYLRHVLRLRSGDRVEIFDGEGAGYSGTVRVCGAEVLVEALSPQSVTDDPQPALILAQALIKAERFEWILQKGTELGVDRFIPVESRFCNVRISKNRIDGRMERWNRIVRDAARQSCRLTVPGISSLMTLPQVLSLDEPSGYKGLFLHECTAGRWDGCVPDAPGFVLCVGPEGGWDSSEAEAAASAGFMMINLGWRVLRAETAALAAITLVRFRTAGCGFRTEQ